MPPVLCAQAPCRFGSCCRFGCEFDARPSSACSAASRTSAASANRYDSLATNFLVQAHGDSEPSTGRSDPLQLPLGLA